VLSFARFVLHSPLFITTPLIALVVCLSFLFCLRFQLNYVHGDKLRIMSCMHQYHVCCIDQWVNSGNSKCPTCQKKFTMPRPAGF
jgi:hypothetical protein